ncbi:hypothetical protein JXE04_03760 [Patescibacteria group bacterium]|nr:hypothetical protein [Patescibacteria group bacterium]
MKNKFIKHKIAFLAMVIFLSLGFSACSTSKQNTNNANVASNNVTTDRRPDFGQPERLPDVRGIVKSVSGNEATILEVEASRGTASSTQTTTEKAATSLTGEMAIPTGSGQGGGFMGGGGRLADDSSRSDMLERLKEMSTGESKILIPVGIRMLKADTSSDDGKREMLEANLSDVTADKTLTIWLDQSITDKKVAEFVLIN